MSRLLVTGSRNWQDYKLIETTMTLFVDLLGLTELSVGDCPFGADLIAENVGRTLGLEVQVFRARWGQHGLAAGPIRNGEMVARGADLCLAYPLSFSKGTRDCIRQAQAAGIDTLIYEGAR